MRRAAPHATYNASVTRRKALQLLVLPVMIRPVVSVRAETLPGLPEGARQFSNVLGAQRQWNSLLPVLQSENIRKEDWDNIRAYLRSVYSVSGDMEYVCKRWDAGAKQSGVEIIREFRLLVKGLDTPAIAKDATSFIVGHEKVATLFTRFLSAVVDAGVGGIPDEL